MRSKYDRNVSGKDKKITELSVQYKNMEKELKCSSENTKEYKRKLQEWSEKY